MKKLNFGLIGLLVLCLSSCKKEDESKDTDKPTIGFVKAYNGSEATTLSVDEETAVSLDSTVTITISVADNESLSQLKAEVHSAFDDHGHDHARPLAKADEEFSFNKVVSLSGKSEDVSFTLWDKKTTNSYEHGDYHLEVIVLDKEGNQIEKVYTLEIED